MKSHVIQTKFIKSVEILSLFIIIITYKCVHKSVRKRTSEEFPKLNLDMKKYNLKREKSLEEISIYNVPILSALNETTDDFFKILAVSIQHHLFPSREWIDTKCKWKRNEQRLRLTKTE